MEPRNDFQHTTDLALLCNFKGTLRAGKKGHFRTAAYKTTAFVDRLKNPPRRCEIDPEGLLSKEVFPRCKHVAIELLMQVVRYRYIHHVELRICQQLVIVRRLLRTRRNTVKPREGARIQVGHRRQHWPDSDIR